MILFAFLWYSLLESLGLPAWPSKSTYVTFDDWLLKEWGL